ncbi:MULTISPECIES: hypothetical protein [Gammaproteobacteria]|jgi:predicted nucleotidyltransferase|nr:MULTISPECIES: hypothetical protein [Gammaproteobacteria]MDO6749750.1 hypothetical protein [Gilvimarinus sp. 1_MG-2023]MDP2609108.1 hypothetical protein [Oceanobacter sp. 1_MG-2023]MDP2612430.1 hypothetical protein [Oceanobacter sp. 2_MG-2023]
MNREQTLTTLRNRKHELQDYVGVRELSRFGSTARVTNTDNR